MTPTVEAIVADIPVVAIDPHVGPGDGVPTVEADSFGGAVSAVKYLIELGHRRIGFVAGRPDLRSSRARDAGYRRALADSGIPYDAEIVRVGFYEQDAARTAALSLLESPRRPTAVFAANDLSAIGIIEVAREIGLEVPRDLSVIGFDDVLEASRMSPPLTTIRQPMAEIGRKAVELLIEILEGRQDVPLCVTLPHRLIIRQSVGEGPAIAETPE